MQLVETYQPIRTLKPVAPDIWIVDGPIEKMRQFGLSIPFPTRMTVIRLPGRQLFVHSPVKPDEALFQLIADLGEVKHLVSPNKIHYASVGSWAERFPNAICWASPGVRERAKSHNITVHFDCDLGDEPDAAWAGWIDQLIFRGSSFMDEVVFFHKSSKTLILADLIENFERSKTNRLMHWPLKLAGNLDPDGKLPIDLRFTFRGSYKQAYDSYMRMLAWQPSRVILAHGRCYDKDGTEEIKRAFRWLTGHLPGTS